MLLAELWSAETMDAAPGPPASKATINHTHHEICLSSLPSPLKAISSLMAASRPARSGGNPGRQVDAFSAGTLPARPGVAGPATCVFLHSLGMKIAARPPFSCIRTLVVPLLCNTALIFNTRRAAQSLPRLLVQSVNKHWEWLSSLTGTVDWL